MKQWTLMRIILFKDFGKTRSFKSFTEKERTVVLA